MATYSILKPLIASKGGISGSELGVAFGGATTKIFQVGEIIDDSIYELPDAANLVSEGILEVIS